MEARELKKPQIDGESLTIEDIVGLPAEKLKWHTQKKLWKGFVKAEKLWNNSLKIKSNLWGNNYVENMDLRALMPLNERFAGLC